MFGFHKYIKILHVDLCRDTQQPELTTGVSTSQFVVVNVLAMQEE